MTERLPELLDAKALRLELGVTRATAEAIMRRLPTVRRAERIGETFGDRDPSTVSATEIAEWIADLSKTRKPGTLNQYLIVFGSCSTTSGSSRTLPENKG